MKLTSTFINIISGIYVLLAIAGAISAYFLSYPAELTEIGNENVKDAGNAALAMSNDLVKQLITLCTGLIGFCVWLFRRPLASDPAELVERYLWTCMAVLLLVASLFAGFITLQRTLLMVAWKSFDPRLDIVWWPQFLQFYLFVFGAAVLGLACIRSLNVLVEKQ
ncbi:hypothetical protein ACC671_22160 [Rhizobium ruizarguesonis]|uniref:hypothetical protein n=1 Tax=Rhizobium leguminosarum TaxID=384 RepID=UPI001C928A8A|nr:hypothetical protein [Rhizobium leguminosarum]MBY3043188.1 hypothetical protein [Rhizobium leguminosarum]